MRAISRLRRHLRRHLRRRNPYLRRPHPRHHLRPTRPHSFTPAPSQNARRRRMRGHRRWHAEASPRQHHIEQALASWQEPMFLDTKDSAQEEDLRSPAMVPLVQATSLHTQCPCRCRDRCPRYPRHLGRRRRPRNAGCLRSSAWELRPPLLRSGRTPAFTVRSHPSDAETHGAPRMGLSWPHRCRRRPHSCRERVRWGGDCSMRRRRSPGSHGRVASPPAGSTRAASRRPGSACAGDGMATLK